MSNATSRQKINQLANDNTYGLHGTYRKTWEPDRAYEHNMSRKERHNEEERNMHDGYQALANAIVARAYKDYVNKLLFGINSQNRDAESFLKSDILVLYTRIPGDNLIRMAKDEVKLIKSLTRDYNEALFLKYKMEGKISITLREFRDMRQDKALAYTIQTLEKKMGKYGDILTDATFDSLARDRFENSVDKDKKKDKSKDILRIRSKTSDEN